MKNLFNSIKLTKPKNNVFDLTHDVKLSLNMGVLTPILCMEAVPGDKFNLSCESLLRFAPLIAPVMHRMDVTMHYYFVPNRILWPNWESFITKGANGTSAPAFPTLDATAGNYGLLADYLGIPKPGGGAVTEVINAMPFAAYQCIYNEYYRDQNMVTEVPFQLVDGTNMANFAELSSIRLRAWEHDYFTSALPFAQRGTAVDLPLGTVDITLDPDWDANGSVPNLQDPVGNKTVGTPVAQDAGGFIEIGGDNVHHAYDPDGSLVGSTQSTTINDLRRAFRLQEWLEKNARGGARYVENILAHFGVRSSDKRLQRPEYITGTKSPVVVSEIVNTTGTTDLPQGNMSGHGISVTSGKYGKYFCEEHGYIVGIMSVLPKTAYFQGIPKHFLKFQDPFQYYWPSFANIGEQPVQNNEIFAYTGTGTNTFGYVPRYAEYKYMPSRVCGEFRTSLDFWHLAREFGTLPSLNADFVECDPSTRIFAVTDENDQHLYAHVLNKIKAVRPMPMFGTPQF